MIKPASLKDLPQYPITAAFAIGALVVTVAGWSGWDIGPLVMNGRTWAKWELWRSITSTLPHVNAFHLAFNLYWFWIFGTLLESVYGHFKFAGMICLLAVSSMLAEFAVFEGGVGLSGVGYGLWGMLWVLDRRDPAFHGTVDRRTSEMFIGWFFLCIVLTVTNVMPVANLAHGVGALMGALLGLIATSRGLEKQRNIAAVSILTVACVLSATIYWPWVNLSRQAEPSVEHEGLERLSRGQVKRAIRLLETAAHMRKAPPRAWFNLGVAYHQADRYEDAATAYEHAANMPGGTKEMDEAARALRLLLAAKKSQSH
jgi:membrane associated rhomboid family serine protease